MSRHRLPDEEIQKIVNLYYKTKSQRSVAEALNIAQSTVSENLAYAESIGMKPRVRVASGQTPTTDTPPKIRVIWFTDAHNQPGMSLERFEWLAKFVNEWKPDVLIDGGDRDDLNSLCKYEGNETWAGKFKPAFLDDLAASKEMNELLAERITHPCEKHLTLGNHEDRLWSFENRNPEIYGMMQHSYLEAQDGWKITPYKGYLDIGGVDFTHVPMNGLNKPMGGGRCAVQVASKSIRDVCFGHTHTYGYWEESKLGPSRSTIAINGGTFMPKGYVPKYATGSAKNYWYGCHALVISEGRIIQHTPVTMGELKDRYR